MFSQVADFLDNIFPPHANPWRHLGGLAFLCLLLSCLSGIIAYTMYDTSVQGAYESGLRLQNDPMRLGPLLRGLHRYAADAAVLLVLLHLIRETVQFHFLGARWFSWLTGLGLPGLLLISGLTGLWLLWDERALYSVTATAQWLQALPLGSELLARNFLSTQALNDRFFSLIMFIHIGVPLLLLGGTWVHVQRISMARFYPPRSLIWGSLGMLVALALAFPAESLNPADTSFNAAQLSLDWFFMFIHPLAQALSDQTVWLMVSGVGLALAMLPLLTKFMRTAVSQPAQVHLAHCNGCGRCAADCPFNAVMMTQRSDASPHKFQAWVNPNLCTACGICVGACPSSTPFRRIEDIVSGIDMPDLTVAMLRNQLKHELAALTGLHQIVLFSCRQAANLSCFADHSTAVIPLHCAAMLPPSFIDYALRLGAAGVILAGCKEGACEFRLGDQWVRQRMAGLREPQLRARVPRERLRVLWPGRDHLVIQKAAADLRRSANLTALQTPHD